MSLTFDTDSNLVFYFLLQPVGYDSSNNDILNLAFLNFGESLTFTSSSTANFVERFWVEMNSQTSTEGTVNSAMLFDNYTCLNNKTRLYMTSSSSYANSIVSLTSQEGSYSVELWMRPQSGSSGQMAIASLADYSNPAILYFTLR